MIAQLKELIDGTDELARDKRAELRGVISTKPGLNRYLRVTPGGLLRIDAGKAKAEENLDGKYLLRTSDPKMTAEDIALGYKQLLEVERGWRDMKQVIDLRPGLPPQGRADPRPRHPLLARPAPGPRRRERLRRHLARTAPPARPHPRRHLHRPRRHLPPAHRDQPTPSRDILEQARHRPAAEDLPAQPQPQPADQRKHRLDTRPAPSPGHVPARQTPDSSAIALNSCGTQAMISSSIFGG